ncbi:hypothetical protein GCM10009850_003620 [Nonomuraea monospora]|uniref:Uncharacterized protein n=1 Tax=Nonomuraea monospora TaxID=568818 RepID=A0ABN3C569_9ACTN
MPDGGHEVGQGLAGAGARLDGQVLVVVDGLLDGADHGDLALPFAPAESVDRDAEQCVHWWEMGVRHGTKRYRHSGVAAPNAV